MSALQIIVQNVIKRSFYAIVLGSLQMNSNWTGRTTMLNTAKNLIKTYKNNISLMAQQAEKLCNDHSPFWSVETDVYYFSDGSVLWINSYDEYGDTYLWFVFDLNNGIISDAYQCYDQAVDKLLEYVKSNPDNAVGFYGIVDLFGNEEIYNG